MLLVVSSTIQMLSANQLNYLYINTYLHVQIRLLGDWITLRTKEGWAVYLVLNLVWHLEEVIGNC